MTIGPYQDQHVLVRPDGYIGLITDGDDIAGVRNYLTALTK